MRAFSLSLQEVLALAKPSRTAGSYQGEVTGIASLAQAQKGDLSFFESKHFVNISDSSVYERQVAETAASVLLLPEGMTFPEKEAQLHLYVQQPSWTLALLCRRVDTLLNPRPSAGIHPTAVVDRDAIVHPDCHVGPLCYVGPFARLHQGVILHSSVQVRAHASVGEHTELKSRVVVMEDCEVGKNCILHAGAVIGSDGYAYEFNAGRFEKIPQIGRVVIGDHVEIGANTTIDRARFGETKIGEGTKIDNLVQIGHNVVVGKHCLIVAQTGIAGSTIVEDYVMMGGQAGVAGHLRIGKGAKLAAQAGVTASVDAGCTVGGNPAMDLRKAYRLEVLKRKLPELFKRIEALEQKKNSEA